MTLDHSVENIPNRSRAITSKLFSVLDPGELCELAVLAWIDAGAGAASEFFTLVARGGQRNVRVYAQRDESLPAANATLDTRALPTVGEISRHGPRPPDRRRFSFRHRAARRVVKALWLPLWCLRFELIQKVRPCLHHLPPLRQVLSVVVSRPHGIALTMRDYLPHRTM